MFSLKKLFKKQKKQRRPDLTQAYTEALDAMFNNREEYLIVDTETTGLDDSCRVIELCIMDLNGRVRYSSLFNPQEEIRPEVSLINGITPEMVSDKPLFVDEVSKFIHLIEGKKLIAWNSAFDKKVLNHELRNVFTMPLQADWCDAMKIYCHVRRLGKDRFSLASAVKAEGLARSDAHRAEGDCRDVLNVLFELWSDR